MYMNIYIHIYIYVYVYVYRNNDFLKLPSRAQEVQEPDIHEAFDDGLSALRVELAAAFWQASKRGRIRLLDAKR